MKKMKIQNMVSAYNMHILFDFYKGTGKIRLILIDGVKGLDDV